MAFLKIPGVNNGHPIIVKEIIRIQAISNYSRIYFSNGKVVVVAKVLHWFEDSLPETMFARVHRSHLVNKLFVEKIKGVRSKSLLLYNGESIAVSRRRKVLIG
jgi:two-component system, LytTR family, response regulator